MRNVSFGLLLLILLFSSASAIIINDGLEVQNYTSLSYKLPSNGTMPLTGRTMNFDALVSTGVVIRQIDFDFAQTDAGTYDYDITLYDGISTITGFVNITRPYLLNPTYTFTISANGETITNSFLPLYSNGIYRAEYMYHAKNFTPYIGIHYCTRPLLAIFTSEYTSCGIPLILVPLSKKISSNPMTHFDITENITEPAPPDNVITVNIDLVDPGNIAGNEPAAGHYSCDITDIGTYPGCVLNWIWANIPGAEIIFTIIAALWGIGAFFFSNFILFALLIPAIIFAYRVNIEPDIFLAISRTSVDMIYLGEMALRFVLYVIKIFIPI
jgi:hypothetical protein